MKKIYLSALLLNTLMVAGAQTALTAKNFNETLNEKAERYAFDANGFITAGSVDEGLPQVWDYSTLYTMHTQRLEVLPTVASPYAPDFVSANVAISSNYVDFDYYMIGETGKNYYGSYTGDVKIQLDDPGKVYTYPIRFLSSYTDSFSGTYYAGDFPVTRSGQILTLADAQGKIMLPTGDFDNVLRVKSIWNYQDVKTTKTGNDTTRYEVTTYEWLAAGIHFPLLQYREEKTTLADGSIQNKFTGYYLDPSSVTVGSKEPDPSFTGFTLSPNPSNTNQVQLWFDNGSTQDINLAVFNASGQQVMGNIYYLNEGSNLVEVPTKELEPGVYYVELAAADTKAVRKLVVE